MDVLKGRSLFCFTFLTPRKGAWAGLGAVPLRPATPPGRPPPSWSDTSSPPPPPQAASLHYFPSWARPGRVPIWALRPHAPSHPAELGFMGIKLHGFL